MALELSKTDSEVEHSKNYKSMENYNTTPKNNKDRETIQDESSWPYVKMVLAIMLLSFSLLAAHAQNGKLKVKGDIVNVAETEKSLVTLFRLDKGGEVRTALGQYMVEGNDWFKTYMEMEKRYLLEVASTNGLTKRYYFDMSVPDYAEDSRYRLEFEIDMSYSGDRWVVVNPGEIVYSDAGDEFTYNNWTQENSMALNPAKP